MIGVLRRKPTTHHRFTTPDRERSYPAPFPSGWYRIADSDDVRRAEVMAVDCLGRNRVVYRGRDSGEVVALDAHCPHQGASLAAGGTVCGDGITCPFHRWRFGPDGRLLAIPNLDRVPRTGVRAWPVRELHGMVWLYHDVSGERIDPPYEPPAIAGLDDGTLVYRGAYDAGEVGMHVSEFAENSVDFQHFAALHGDLTVPWTQTRIPGLGIRHRPGWEVDPEHGHIAYFSDEACITVRGKPYPRTGAVARITIFGPGGIVWFRFTLPDLGDIVLFQTHQPVEPLVQHVRFRWYAHPRVPRPLVWWVVGHWVSQWRADIEIWENKVFRRRPVLVPIDGPVHRMRRWYSQFYGKGGTAADDRTS